MATIASDLASQLTWQQALPPADQIALRYAALLDSLDGVIAARAVVRHGELAILTLIERSRELEKQLHDIELQVMDWAGDPPVRFAIYDDADAFEQANSGAALIFVA